jgi:hypothetical protein
MGVYNNNKDGTRSTLANTIQVVDAPIEQFVSRGEFNAIVPSDTSADNKLVNDDTVKDIWKVQGELGAKNLLKFPYVSASQTVNGITFTVNDDGSVAVSGTATANAFFNLQIIDFGNISMRTYNDTFKNSSYAITDGIDGHSINFYVGYDGNNKKTFIVVSQGTTIDNVTVYPMIRYASDTDDTWQPYAPTNYQLNQKINMTAGVYLPNATNTGTKKVVASVGQTSVTFDATSFMTRYNVTASDLDLDISAETTSGDVVAYNNVSVTGGIVTVTFDALAEQTTFICKCSVIQ